MTDQQSIPTGAPCWIDLMTSDVDRSRSFYCELFGWTADDGAEEFGGYFNFAKDGAQVAGGMPRQPGMEMPDCWSIYLASDDAEKTAQAVAAHGGQVHVEPMVVADAGTMAFVGDSTGAPIGIWQPGQHRGFAAQGVAGTPSWFELHTRDYEGALGFYRDVFGWQTQVESDTPQFRYSTMVHGEVQRAGIMDASSFLPEGVASHWSVYFGVDDADAALAQVERLGGSIVRPTEDTPYGRLAEATDPTGARFKLVAPNEAMPAKDS